MRELVGPTSDEAFDNPTGSLVYPYLPKECYRNFLDFGCGCGRVARQLMLQELQPEAYLGIDLHRGMIEWAQRNLTPVNSSFRFEHHDVYNVRFNPEASADRLPFPAGNQSFSLVHALSVFTHLTEDQSHFYIREVSRTLKSDGYFLGSWFLFE